MKIYKLNINVDNYRSCFIRQTSLTKKELRNFCSAKPMNISFNSIMIDFDTERDFPIGDVTYCWDFKGIIISKKGKICLENKIKNNIEFINFYENFYILNNLCIFENAINQNNSEFEIINNEIFGINKYSFNSTDFPILFQITLPDGYVVKDYFVTEDFIKIVEENDLKGFLFEEVWDSDKE